MLTRSSAGCCWRAAGSAGATLADAAAAGGFSDQSHMTRLFVRAYGLSPGRYAAAARPA